MVFNSNSLKLLSRVSFHKLHSHTAFPRNSNHNAVDDVAAAICDSFRRRRSWDAVSRKFGSLELNDSLVEQVLLELKDPNDAKTALSFFHWSAKTHRFNHGVRSYSIAIHVLVRAGLITDARALLESLAAKNRDPGAVRAVTDSLIDAVGFVSGSHRPVLDLLVQTYAKMRLTEAAFDVCCNVEARGFRVSLASFNSVLHVLQRSDRVSLVWDVYEHMIRGRNYPNAVTLKIMIDALCKEGLLQRNVDALDRIMGERKRSSHSPSAIVNSSLILRMVEKGHLVEEEGKRERVAVMVVTLLKRLLQQNLVPDSVGYSLIVHAKVRLGSLDSALEMYEEMVMSGFEPNSFVYTSFTGGFCKEGRIDEAMELMRGMEGRGLKPYGETFDHVIIGCAAGSGRLEECLGVFEAMLGAGFIPSCLSFDKMVEKLCENRDVEQANANLTRLLDKGFLPGETTYSLLIKGYAAKGEVQEVLKLYYEMEYKSMCPGLSVFTSVIQCLCRCGKLEDAEKYLKTMKSRLLTPDVAIYETMIASHEQKGNNARVLQLCNEMASLEL
ncbi:pentatricopeptide repeat-containing protein At1g66345, mitochondrial [Lotus japonicus]|uniref:pentatricopeptide repeat-containing protein At1g66345, mitochondrial n=1 Tax=Lotus japonicus TaxID=34305 RepID=UPI002589284A|nr:pentatricopeptide repeat-containing protein At1g66345, mitochondrial [Lotus japonicus]XP_057445235.1 pentatricopeptide repeat-containing protein At1g66345, mitochondrial [Lotus japonicus]XP_057445236.1 pentatricopeptide repeat-containing protein At1g66345, mitochondrial [Lotus japonicus]XP_057445237.1 pentatricopeptide repeat-containing protein At1g66345, mitochondrial [Lotus japonicus]XP_057445238.1 pentatricopeptide repeat-containing protein At1g66345, mitochondrial [Lotus japonicus]XP_05